MHFFLSLYFFFLFCLVLCFCIKLEFLIFFCTVTIIPLYLTFFFNFGNLFDLVVPFVGHPAAEESCVVVSSPSRTRGWHWGKMHFSPQFHQLRICFWILGKNKQRIDWLIGWVNACRGNQIALLNFGFLWHLLQNTGIGEFTWVGRHVPVYLSKLCWYSYLKSNPRAYNPTHRCFYLKRQDCNWIQ